MVPGAASNDFVEPIIIRTVLIAFSPSRTHTTTVPDEMNDTNLLKNDFSLCME
jgi:hypothetical protein